MSTLLKNGLFQAAPRRRLDMHPRDASAQCQKNVPKTGFTEPSQHALPAQLLRYGMMQYPQNR